jgi:hypothetical protein
MSTRAQYCRLLRSRAFCSGSDQMRARPGCSETLGAALPLNGALPDGKSHSIAKLPSTSLSPTLPYNEKRCDRHVDGRMMQLQKSFHSSKRRHVDRGRSVAVSSENPSVLHNTWVGACCLRVAVQAQARQEHADGGKLGTPKIPTRPFTALRFLFFAAAPEFSKNDASSGSKSV